MTWKGLMRRKKKQPTNQPTKYFIQSWLEGKIRMLMQSEKMIALSCIWTWFAEPIYFDEPLLYIKCLKNVSTLASDFLFQKEWSGYPQYKWSSTYCNPWIVYIVFNYSICVPSFPVIQLWNLIDKFYFLEQNLRQSII